MPLTELWTLRGYRETRKVGRLNALTFGLRESLTTNQEDYANH